MFLKCQLGFNGRQQFGGRRVTSEFLVQETNFRLVISLKSSLRYVHTNRMVPTCTLRSGRAQGCAVQSIDFRV